MNDFLQMDIFFFISSLVALVFLSLVVVVWIYVLIFIKRTKTIIDEIEKIVKYTVVEGKGVIDMLVSKIDSTFNNVGVVEKTVLTVIGSLLAKKNKKRGKIKKEVPKK